MAAKRILKRRAFRALAFILGLVILLLCADRLVEYIGKYLYPKAFGAYVEKYCKEYNVNENFCFAMIKCESNFKKDAESSAGAVGLMQLTEDTFQWTCNRIYGEVQDASLRYDPATNIRCGVYYLSWLKQKFTFDAEVVAAYNAGPYKVEEWHKNPDYSDDGKTLKKTPYPETENHIKKVLRAEEIYKKLYDKGETSK